MTNHIMTGNPETVSPKFSLADTSSKKLKKSLKNIEERSGNSSVHFRTLIY